MPEPTSVSRAAGLRLLRLHKHPLPRFSQPGSEEENVRLLEPGVRTLLQGKEAGNAIRERLHEAAPAGLAPAEEETRGSREGLAAETDRKVDEPR